MTENEVRASVWSEDQSLRAPRRSRREPSANRQSQTSDMTWVPSTSQHHLDQSKRAREEGVPKGEGGRKVVIDRVSQKPKLSTDPTSPALEVPIPNYKLGTPRFSTRGTAFLHSSVYTSTSGLEDSRLSASGEQGYDTLFPAPPQIEQRSILSRRHSHTSPQPFVVRIHPSVENVKGPQVSSTPTFHRSDDPITASLYDQIAANPDDPSTVRYASSSRDITAATPARIIAQITSKDFVDYELISDFFLTVRSYLSTHDLAAYLLARFEWAIERPNDDGQVIRVRVFAALRHWILNYFPYDFVTDRELRVKFCDRLNAMSRKARDRTNGPSDMKLILDLKKCWNGRCATYWDPPVTDSSSQTELEINPGGIAGSRDSRLTHPSHLPHKPSETGPVRADFDTLPSNKTTALNNWLDNTIEQANNGHGRQISAATTHTLPMSPISEQSIQAMSCTIPGKGLKKFLVHSGPSIGAHPVPSIPAMKRVCPAAPSAASHEPSQQSKQAHKRSGSFSDAVRDRRASLPSMHSPSANDTEVLLPYPGSLVRGNILPPGPPHIDQYAPTSPTEELVDSYDSDSEEDRTEGEYESDDYERSPHLGPGVKNFLGNIRRALSSKQYASFPPNATVHHISTPNLGSKGLKSSRSRFLKHEASKQPFDAFKKDMRLDFLCADVTAMFQRALLLEHTPEIKDLGNTVPNHSAEQARPSIAAKTFSGQSFVPSRQRNPSQTTYGSRSIVIFNETGEQPPVPQVPSKFSGVVVGSHSDEAQEGSSTLKDAPPMVTSKEQADLEMQKLQQQSLTREATNELSNPAFIGPKTVSNLAEQSQAKPKLASQKILSSRDKSLSSSRTDSRSLRKYASYQSGMTRHGGDNMIATTLANSTAQRSSKGADNVPQQRMLRRRPGGDLRANENVHDLEQITRSRSTGSIATFSESARGSEMLSRQPMKSSWDRASQKALPDAQDGLAQIGLAEEVVQRIPSLVRSLSQPALRPSFEAAVAEFARIPDDEGGDIEATILKLEGKYRKNQIKATKPELRVKQPREVTPDIPSEEGQGRTANELQSASLTATSALGVTTPARSQDTSHRDNMTLSVYAESEESYDSTPLLERSLSQKPKKTDRAKGPEASPTPRPLFSPKPSYEDPKPQSLSHVGDKDLDNDSLRRSKYLSSIPTTTDSFLLDEDEFLSDLSSELSFATVHPEDRPQEEETYSSVPNGMPKGSQESRTFSNTHPPSPPMTSDKPLNFVQQFDPTQYQRKPPTPDPSPVSRIKGTPTASSSSLEGPIPTQTNEFTPSQHLPFILCYDAPTLAQQFTLVEKDALSEVSWQDLVSMRWHHKSPSTLNWVEYLQTQDPTGIELVTARFNVMVKWCLSEIVLTQNLGERALVILKFIHVAKQCRKMHNYATMFQLTIALTSVDCSRLTKTWALIPPAEKRAVAEMEKLVSPIKNFMALREEMETSNSEEGCIPVIGMFLCPFFPLRFSPSLFSFTFTTELPLLYSFFNFSLILPSYTNRYV